MARGKKASDVIFFNLRTETSNGKPVFLVQKGDEKTEAHFVEGRVTNILVKSYESKKGPFTQVKLYMNDGEERYIVSFSMTILGRSILNSLINKKSIDRLSINLYKSKTGNPAVYIEINGEKAGRAYSKETIEKKCIKKGTFDIASFDKLLLDQIDAIKESLAYQEDSSEDTSTVSEDLEGDDTLPF